MTHRAYGYARLSAQRSGLLKTDDIAAMRCASDEGSASRVARSLGIETEAKRFERLLGRYRAIFNCYADARPVVRALLGLHEIENVKLGWSAVARAIDVERWTPLWHDLHELASVSRVSFVRAHTLYDVVGALATTPFAAIATDVYMAHASDLGSAELALDRWAGQQVVMESGKLAKSEALARQIAEGIVHLRDIEIDRRGTSAYGLSAEAIAAARVLPQKRKWPDLNVLCRRAFRGQTRSLAPAVAYAALAERDYRIARAVAERGGDSLLDAAADLVIGWSNRST